MNLALLALSPRSHGGQYQYTVTLLDALRELGRRGLCELTIVHRRDYEGGEGDGVRAAIRLEGRSVPAAAWLATYLGTPMPACRKGSFDVAVSPKTSLAAHNVGRTSVVTIHDLQHRHLPHFFSWPRRVLRDWLYRRSAHSADAIVCETEYVKRDIVECYRVPEGRVYVVPSPPPKYLVSAIVDEAGLAEVRRRYRLPGRYLFYPAQFWAHKNHLLLVESLALLKKAFGLDVALVLVGSRKENFGRTMRRVRELKLESQVVYLGYVPDQDIPYLFKAAGVLVVPSFFESLSIPIWEAFHLGVPVVCANTCAFPEQVGRAALMFDPHSVTDCANQIHECLTNETLARRLTVRGRERVAGLTLPTYADQWRRVLESVVAN